MTEVTEQQNDGRTGQIQYSPTFSKWGYKFDLYVSQFRKLDFFKILVLMMLCPICTQNSRRMAWNKDAGFDAKTDTLEKG